MTPCEADSSDREEVLDRDVIRHDHDFLQNVVSHGHNTTADELESPVTAPAGIRRISNSTQK